MKAIQFKEEYDLSPIMTEVYNRLRTTIEFSGDSKVFCITSCAANDGKSTVAQYLAYSLALNGNRVLLIDADLRNSVMHHRMDFPANTVGLCHYLVGKAGVQDVIYETNRDNLFFVPIGETSKHPSELLSNKRFAQFVDAARKVFEYVIIDTAPVNAVVDPVIVANQCDAYMIVAASQINSKAAVRQAINDMSVAKSVFLGVVLNKVKESAGGYSHYHNYRYSYGYGAKSKRDGGRVNGKSE